MREELPKGWITGRLNEIVCSVKTGVPKYTGEKKYYSTGSIHNNTCENEGCYSFFNRPSRANRVTRFNDVFQARMKETDKGLLIVKELAEQLFSTGFLQLRPFGETYLPKLLYYFIKSHEFLHQRDELATGSTQEALTDNKAKEINFPLPPLKEQKRIVAKLDQIMPRIEGVKERLERIPQIIKRFRQSVLTAAVTGKLTEKWREEHPEVESTEELFKTIHEMPNSLKENYLNVFSETQYEKLPNNWIYAPLINLGKIVGGGTPSKSKKEYWRGDIPWISPKDMKVDRIVDSKDHINKIAISNSSAKLITNKSILIVVRGMILRHTFPTAINVVDVTINQDMKAIVSNSYVIPEFLHLVFKKISWKILNYVKEATHGTMRIELPIIQSWAIPVPHIEEQKEIVRQVNNLFVFAVKLEDHYKMAKEKVDKLPQSILAKAFRGELVPQWPDLPAPQPGKYWVYVVKCENDTNYIGQTSNLRNRWSEHLEGEGSDWTKRYSPHYVMYWERCDSREHALKREKELKSGFGRKWIKREETAGRLWRAGEPAEKLLERIKEEKVRLESEIKKTKKKTTRRRK